MAAMALAARVPMTADEFFVATVELPRAQLIDGVLVLPMNGPRFHHQLVLTLLMEQFVLHRSTHPHAGWLFLPLDIEIDDLNVFQPDLYWVPGDDVPALDARRFIDTRPPLVVEVLSPSTRLHDLGAKLDGYLRAGGAEVWTIDTEAATVTVHRPDAEPVTRSDRLTTPLVPGWTIDLRALFAFPT